MTEEYELELKSPQWRKQRHLILKRDGFKCQRCGAKTTKYNPLHVHHLSYILGYHVWDYENDNLITLCESCHQEVHDNETIPIYLDSDSDIILNYHKCKRCDGKGYIWEYRHVKNGICFRCGGLKYEELIPHEEKKSSRKVLDSQFEESLYDEEETIDYLKFLKEKFLICDENDWCTLKDFMFTMRDGIFYEENGNYIASTQYGDFPMEFASELRELIDSGLDIDDEWIDEHRDRFIVFVRFNKLWLEIIETCEPDYTPSIID